MNEINAIIAELNSIAARLSLMSSNGDLSESDFKESAASIHAVDTLSDFIESLTSDQLKEAANHEYYTFKMPNGEDLTVAKSFAIDELEKRGLKP